MAELHEQANWLQEENKRLRTRLKVGQAEQSRDPFPPPQFPPSLPGKGKDVVAPDDIDLPTDDELSYDNSPLPRRSPSSNAAEARFKKRPPRQSGGSVSVARRHVRREPSKDQRSPMPAHQYVPDRAGGFPPPVPSMYLPLGAAPAPRMIFSSTVWGPQDMLSTPLRQHILDYDPPRGFSIPPFTMYDGFSYPYDHMLHFKQAMILNTGDDRLLCKVFPASLKGPALAWFHKLPRGSINTFDEMWAAFVSQYLCSVRQNGTISSLQSILKREDESIREFTRRFRQAVQQIDVYNMDAVLQNFRRSFGPTTPFFQSLSLDPPATMEELYRRADKFSMLEDNIRAASQTVIITTQSGKPAAKGPSEQKSSQGKGQKRLDDQSEKRKDPPPPIHCSQHRL